MQYVQLKERGGQRVSSENKQFLEAFDSNGAHTEFNYIGRKSKVETKHTRRLCAKVGEQFNVRPKESEACQQANKSVAFEFSINDSCHSRKD